MERPSEYSYQDLHEAFISNHAGTSPWEVFLNLTISVGGFFICHLLKHTRHPWMKLTPIQFILEFFIIVIPQLWALTCGCDHADMMVVTMLIIIVTLHLPGKHPEHQKREPPRPARRKYAEQHLVPYQSKHYTFMTNVRAMLFLTTAICILAVDFPIFPRRFAKAETYGFGLMDIGVGFFIFVNAGVSPEAMFGFQPGRRLAQFKKGIVSCFPLIVLGILRLISTSAANYHTHVSEYGIHWNFFFTLAATKTLSSTVFVFISPAVSGFLAVFLGIAYQVALHLGLRHFALFGTDGQGSRDGLLNANREGIVSSLGYLTLYLAGVSIMRFIYNTEPRLRFWMHKALLLGVLLVIFTGVTWISHNYIEEVSRRMVNLTYILWMITFQIYFVCLFLILDLLLIIFELKKTRNVKASSSFPPPTLIADAIQFNSLWFFLFSNVLTGVVNMSIATIHATSPVAFVVLFAYMLTLCLAAVILRCNNIRIKCW